MRELIPSSQLTRISDKLALPILTWPDQGNALENIYDFRNDYNRYMKRYFWIDSVMLQQHCCLGTNPMISDDG